MNELQMILKIPDEGRGRITFVYTKVHPAIKNEIEPKILFSKIIVQYCSILFK